MSLYAKVDALRERVAEAQPDPDHARPSFVNLTFVHWMGGRRIDIQFQWIAIARDEPDTCWVHTNTTNPRKAIRQVTKVAEHVRPGRRFKASDPTAFGPLPRQR